MKVSRFIMAICFCAFSLTISALNATASIIDFTGQLRVIELNTGGGVYSNTPLGTTFVGSIDDVTYNGQISDGTTLTRFGCCIAAGGLGISNNMELDASTAALLNGVAGFQKYKTGDIVDGVNLEGDTATLGSGRIEIGLSYVFDADTFSNGDLANYPFDPRELRLALFFIYESDVHGVDVYSAVGNLNPVPLPASVWLLGMGLLGLVGIVKRKVFGGTET
jgi:hypothetical protein